MRAYHRHGDTYLYHIMSTKISPPRVTGYMPASGHWRFRGTMTPSRSKQAAPLAAGHPATRSETDVGMHPVTRPPAPLFLCIFPAPAGCFLQPRCPYKHSSGRAYYGAHNVIEVYATMPVANHTLAVTTHWRLKHKRKTFKKTFVYSVRVMFFVMAVFTRFALYLVRDLRGLYVSG